VLTFIYSGGSCSPTPQSPSEHRLCRCGSERAKLRSPGVLLRFAAILHPQNTYRPYAIQPCGGKESYGAGLPRRLGIGRRPFFGDDSPQSVPTPPRLKGGRRHSPERNSRGQDRAPRTAASRALQHVSRGPLKADAMRTLGLVRNVLFFAIPMDVEDLYDRSSSLVDAEHCLAP
jgi:hypothetical protein